MTAPHGTCFLQKSVIPTCRSIIQTGMSPARTGCVKAVKQTLMPSNLVNGTGSELIYSVLKTELEYSFRTSAILNPSEIMFPLLFSSSPTVYRTFSLLLT